MSGVRGAAIAWVFALLTGAVSTHAQESTPKETAFRLPDGTVVFYTKNPGDPLPAIDGVLLSAKDYKQLLEQVEQLKKAKTAKPASPSVCHVLCTLKLKAERPSATFQMTYQFRTSVPNSLVALGGAKAFAVKADLDDRGPPMLDATMEGLVVLVDRPGEHTLKLTLEAPVTPRMKGDLGFDLGLPRAAITTFAFTTPPELKAIMFGTRTADATGKAGDLKTITADPKRYTADSTGTGTPLGPIDSLEVSWDSPSTAPAPTEATLDIDASIRVEDRSVETLATLKLRGPNREWTLILPAGMDLTATTSLVKPQIDRPTDPKSHEWKVTLAAGVTEATLTATLKQPRPDAKTTAPFNFAILAAKGTVRTSGTLRVFAPFNVRFMPLKASTDLRRVDAPAVGDDSPVAVYRFANVTNLDKRTAPLLDYELRPATAFVVAQPQHQLLLTSLGWRLRSTFRVSPVRTALDQLTLELPAGWQDPTFSPLDLVDEVQGGGDRTTARTLTIRFATPQREPFEMTLEARMPLAGESRDASLLLPKLTQTRERDATVSVTVPEPFEVKGTVREWDAGKIATLPVEFTSAKATSLTGRFDGTVARVDVAWQSAKPRFNADMQCDVSLSDRQAVVTQFIRLTFPEAASRTVKLAGPSNLAGFRSTPLLESTGPGEWTYTASSTAKDATLTLSFAVPLKLEPQTNWAVPLVWPDAATVATTVRIGGTTATRRVIGFDGPWRESAPEPSPDRDSLPWLTLSSTGENVPLTLNWAAADPTGSVVIDKAVHQWAIGDDGTQQGRSRFLLKRWPATLEVELPAGGPVSVLVDKQRVEPLVLKSDTPESRVLGIPLPEAKATRTSLLIEIRHNSPKDRPLDPPRLRGAVPRGVAWWQIAPPPGTLPLLFGEMTPEIAWRFNDGLLMPTACVSDTNLDKWLSDANELELTPGDATLTLSQSRPSPLRIIGVPRLPAFALGTLAFLLLGYGLTRLNARWLAPVLATIVIAITTVTLVWPQPMSQFALVAQPGILITVIVLGLCFAVKSWLHKRNARLATFSRGTPPPTLSSPAIGLSAKTSRSGVVEVNSPVPSASSP
ncbi:hypothetical protein BH11PLA2_BH11PLA2_22010 [soil metagenome]